MSDWKKNNPEKRYEQKRREKVRNALRKRGVLPPVGVEMNEEQLRINEQISNNDFSYWDSIKSLTSKKTEQNLDKPIEYFIWLETKKEAKDRGYDFNLGVEDIIIPDKCPYLQTFLDKSIDKIDSINHFTLDRIDTTKGYVKENIHVISRLAKKMKNECSSEILITFAKNVLEIHGN